MVDGVTRLFSPSENLAILLRLSLSITGAMLARYGLGFIDFAMVSQLGLEAQAAISPATISIFTLYAIGTGGTSGVQTLVARYYGSNDLKSAGLCAGQTVYLTIAALFITALLALGSPWLVSKIGELGHIEPAVTRLQTDYISVAIWGLVPCTLASGLTSFFIGIHRPSVGLAAVLVSVAFNIAADYVLIFGKFGIPQFGIRGAAFATVFGWFLRACILLTCYLSWIVGRQRIREALTFNIWQLGGILRLGVYHAIHVIFENAAWVAFLVVIVAPFGTDVMAATNSVVQILIIAFIPLNGLGLALRSRVAVAASTQGGLTVLRVVRIGLVVMMGYSALVGAAIGVNAHGLGALLASEPTVSSWIATTVLWLVVYGVVEAANIAYANALQALGNSRTPAVVTVSCLWLIFVGGGYMLSRLAFSVNVHGAWALCVIATAVSALLLRRWFLFSHGPKRGYRRKRLDQANH